jgi:hypothetical protein
MSETIITCSKCNKTFKRQKNLENHQKLCNGNKCEYCNEIFLDLQYLQKHIQICVYKYINEITNLKNEINSNNLRINELEDQLKCNNQKYNNLYLNNNNLSNECENFKQKYEESHQLVNKLQYDLINKDKEITRLKAIEEISNKRIEDLKQSKPTIIYNTTNTNTTNNNQFANNIHNSTLIHSPEYVLDNIDTQFIFQTNNIRNEEEFAKYLHNKGLTRYIQVTDKSRNKTKYLDKNSQVIKDVNCNLLADKIYTTTKDSAQRLNKELNDKKIDILMDGRVDNKREKNSQIKEIDNKSTLVCHIISKNKESMDKFGKCLTEFAEYNIKQVMDQHKNMTTFITKLISVVNNKNSKIFFEDFKYIGEQLRTYLKKDIILSKLNQHILVKNDNKVNERIDADFLLQLLIDLLRGKNKEAFIKDQLIKLLDNKYDNYVNICNMANFFFDKQSIECLTLAKNEIINGITYDENMITDEY